MPTRELKAIFTVMLVRLVARGTAFIVRKHMKLIYLYLIFFAAIASAVENTRLRLEVFGDDLRAQVVQDTIRVEACILKMIDPSNGTSLRGRSYVEGSYRVIPERMAALMVERLLDPEYYDFNALLGCVPKWDARVRFHKDERIVEVDFCFSCCLIQVNEGGKPVGGGFFKNGSDIIFRVIAMEFPKNRVIKYHKKLRERQELLDLEVQAFDALDRKKKAHSTMSNDLVP